MYKISNLCRYLNDMFFVLSYFLGTFYHEKISFDLVIQKTHFPRLIDDIPALRYNIRYYLFIRHHYSFSVIDVHYISIKSTIVLIMLV